MPCPPRALVVLAALSPLASSGSGCAEVGTITLASSVDAPAADGMTVVELTAVVAAADLPVPDGTRVSFRADDALLFGSRDDARPAFTGARPAGWIELDAATRASAARVFVLAPTEARDVVVDVRFSPEPGVELSEAITLAFGPPPPVSAGAGDVASAGGVDVHFAFACGADNIGALVSGRPDIVVPCRLVLEDGAGAPLPHTPVRLFAEAGELLDLPATPDAPRAVFHVAPFPLTRYPVDVAPLPLEAAHARAGAGLIPGALEQNPRDGLVTLLAVAHGAEAFRDLDGDGAWDDGEPFVDEGEPFLDVDDDGAYDPAIDGPMCCDDNGNGAVDGPNGRWDGDVSLGRVAHVLWTGPIAEGAGRSAVTGPAVIAPGGTARLTLTAVDANFNPVAMLGDDDGLELDTTGPIELAAPDIELGDRLGMVVVDAYPQAILGDGAPAVTALVIDGVRAFSLDVTDARGGSCAPATWTLAAEVRHSAGAELGGTAFAQRVARLVTDGTLSCP